MTYKSILLSLFSAEVLSPHGRSPWEGAPAGLGREIFSVASAAALAAALVFSLAVIFNVYEVPTLRSFFPALSTPFAVGIDIVLLDLVLAHFHVVQRPFMMFGGGVAALPARSAAQHRLLASALLLGFFFAWQPLPQWVWSLTDTAVSSLLWGGWALGWVVLVASLVLLDKPAYLGDLLPLRAVRFLLRRRPDRAVRLVQTLICSGAALGLLLIEWCAPQMSLGHLLFAVAVTVYLGRAGQLHLSAPIGCVQTGNRTL